MTRATLIGLAATLVLGAGAYSLFSISRERGAREAKLQSLRDLGVLTSPEEINSRIPRGERDAADLLADADAMQARIFVDDDLRVYFTANPGYVRSFGSYGSSEIRHVTYTPEMFRKVRITREMRDFASVVDRVLEADQWGTPQDWSVVLPLKPRESAVFPAGVGALTYRSGIACIDALQGHYPEALRGFKAVEHGTDLLLAHPRLELIRSAMVKKANVRYQVLSVLQEDPGAPEELVAFAKTLKLPRVVPWAISGELQALRTLFASPEDLRPYQHSTTVGEVKGGLNWSDSGKQRLAVEAALFDFFASLAEATQESEADYHFERVSRLGKLRKSEDEASQLAATFFADQGTYVTGMAHFRLAQDAQTKLESLLAELDKTKGGAAGSAAPPR